ncbi:PRD domain-containing protein [Rodentibacter caecimuris]|uniref:PRD domain-containing protein n=1 Tax=Rodentibacter caecimuris TaxID=1796644 RepID=A0ABX3KY65_9PAST|nr:hypothetical protein BKG89_05080 [Rodentibacter heylii]
MALIDNLTRLENRGQINAHIINIVFQVKNRLETYWHADTSTYQVEMLLLHLASSLARIQRGYCASPLYKVMFEEIKSAVIFPQVFNIHLDLLRFMPFDIPDAEQSYFIANIYSLLQEQGNRIINPPFLSKIQQNSDKLTKN